MKTLTKIRIGILILFIGAMIGHSSATGAPYESLEGLTGLDIAFDVQLNNPKKAALFLKMIHLSIKDQDLEKMANPSKFVVVFNGKAVTLISENQDRFPEEDRVHLEEIAKRVTLMTEDGIRIEGCLAAAKIFKVDPNLFLGEIQKINNAWISLAGYQAQQFSMIPIY
jgi:hypothetical protein